MWEYRKKEIRKEAENFREKCNTSRYGILDLFKECERSGYKLLRYPLGGEADLGFVVKKDNDTIIFTNTDIRFSREIFTLAHEIGHAILHMESERSFIDDKITIAGRSTDEKEQEANFFAACLLMPEDKVQKFFDLELDLEIEDIESLSVMDIARMMTEFNVSFETALNRLENLGKISSNKKTLLDTEKNERRVGNLLGSVGGNRRLNEASKEIKIPYEYIECVIYNYNHNAIPQETLKRVLAYYRLTMGDVSDKLVQKKDEDDDFDDFLEGAED